MDAQTKISEILDEAFESAIAADLGEAERVMLDMLTLAEYGEFSAICRVLSARCDMEDEDAPYNIYREALDKIQEVLNES